MINKYILDVPFELSKIWKMFSNLDENTTFSQLDLANGFNQVPIKDYSREVTGFSILNRMFVYKRIPFGLKCGPNIFQDLISRLLKDVRNCMVYIDDIIVFGKTEREHSNILLKVLTILQKHEIKVNKEKSKFCVKEIKIMGHHQSKWDTFEYGKFC